MLSPCFSLVRFLFDSFNKHYYKIFTACACELGLVSLAIKGKFEISEEKLHSASNDIQMVGKSQYYHEYIWVFSVLQFILIKIGDL